MLSAILYCLHSITYITKLFIQQLSISPQGSTLEPVGLPLRVFGQVSNQVLPRFVDHQLQQGKRDHRNPEMLEHVVPSPECGVERLEIAGNYNQSNFGGDGEQHECVPKTLRNHGHFSCLAHEGVEDLADHNCIEVGALGVLDPFCGVADGQWASRKSRKADNKQMPYVGCGRR